MLPLTRITAQLAGNRVGAAFTLFRCATGLRYVPFPLQYRERNRLGSMVARCIRYNPTAARRGTIGRFRKAFCSY